MPGPDPRDLADLALLTDAAREAGEIATRFWRKDPHVWDKPLGAGPVSEADLAVDAMLRDTLRQARPGYGWLSEETIDSPETRAGEALFIVDPIDGTRAFLEGSRTWAHSLAVVRNKQVTVGLIYLPLHDRLFGAARHGGAWLNGERIAASTRADPQGATLLANRFALDPALWPGGVPPMERHFRSSLAYRMALVAQGRFDATVTLRETWEWDIAAGSLIATEAGAALSDRTGAAILFDNPRPSVSGLVAGASAVQSDLVARINRR